MGRFSSLLEGARDFFELVGFDDVPVSKVLEIGEPDAALKAGGDFFHVVFESTK